MAVVPISSSSFSIDLSISSIASSRGVGVCCFGSMITDVHSYDVNADCAALLWVKLAWLLTQHYFDFGRAKEFN